MAAYTGNTGFQVPAAYRTDDTVGTVAWTFPQRIMADDASYARPNMFIVGADTIVHREARLLIADAIGSTDRAADESALDAGPQVYGGASDKWGLTSPVGSDVNNRYFGAVINYAESTGDVGNYMITRDYNLPVPDDAVVDGIEMSIDEQSFAGGGGTTGVETDTIKLKVYYSWNVKVNGAGTSSGSVWAPQVNANPRALQKRFRYKVTDKAGNFVGEWRDVESEPTFKNQINGGIISMDVQLGRNETIIPTAVENLMTEADENLTTEDDHNLQIDVAAPTGLGPGTDVELNYNVEVDAFYGEMVELLTEDDHPILTEDDHVMLVADGAPDGRTIFQGFISRWELDHGQDEKIRLTLLSHNQELGHIMLQTADTVEITSEVVSATTETFLGISGAGPSDFTRLAQTFRATASVNIKKISLIAQRWNAYPTVTLELRTGTTIGAGTLLATATAIPDDYQSYEDIDFVFADNIAITSGSDYHFVLSVDQNKTGGNVTYPVTFKSNASAQLANAQYYYEIAESGTFVAAPSAEELVFTVWEAGGLTTRTFTSEDPSNILKAVLDYAASVGSRVVYDADSIDNTGTTVTYTFKANTIDEAIQKCLELAPADWYRYFDPGNNQVHFKARPATVERFLTRGRDVERLTIRRSLERLVNEAYLTGGGNPATFVKTIDADSQTAWRRGLKKVSDSRVTSTATGEILNQAEIDRHSEPEYEGGTTLIDKKRGPDGEDTGHYDHIEDVALGEQLGFMGFGDLVDVLILQAVSHTYKPDRMDIELETLLPPVTKRVEDIKRNLDTTQQEYVPTSPS